MTSKSKANGLNSMHTAGIYSDMTVDGPEIGTLVVIVDRAKNLPNRKTIGKQDPYCAARLGKEAKKTDTDRRGGQTPRWDQELRFTVHDSPDYYQLKVSVFNDDKKTDLIGETWVNLQDMIIPGGGQSDIWHNLNCKGKYAGEIRIEITYYDTRPKQEKLEKIKQASTNDVEDPARDSLKGPRQPQQRTPVKRRPLPADPITGAQAVAPIAAPDHSQLPQRGHEQIPIVIPDHSRSLPRGYQTQSAIPDHIQTPPQNYQPPTAIAEHIQAPLRNYQPPTAVPEHVQTPLRNYQPPTAVPEHVQTPPRNYQPPTAVPEQVQTTPRNYQPPTAIPEHDQMPPQNYQTPTAIPEHVQTTPRNYQPPTAIPEHVQTPPRGYQSPSYIPNQSPLQNVEYNTPPHRISHSQSYENSSNMNGYGASPAAATSTISQQPLNERYELHDHRYDQIDHNHYSQGYEIERYGDREEHIDPRDQYETRQVAYELPQPDEFEPPPSPGGPPPPPPAHRSRHESTHSGVIPTLTSHGSYVFPNTQPQNSYEAPAHDSNRHSLPAYTQSPSYQPYSPAKEEQYRNSGNDNYDQSPPRHHSYDSRYDNNNYGSMQPTVEDIPSSPAVDNYSISPGGHRGSGVRASQYEDSVSPGGQTGSGARALQYDDRRYDQAVSPAPLNLSGRASGASGRTSVSTAPSNQYSNSSMGYPSSYRDRANTETTISSRNSYNPIPQQAQQRRLSEDPRTAPLADYGLPQVPATLVAGMDPIIAQEISDRIYDEKRASFSQSAGNSPRGRYQNSPQYSPSKPHPLSYHEASMVPFVPAAATHNHAQSRFANATTPIVKPRAISPDTRRPIRKSVSPSPGAGPEDGMRRLSGIPFGPDSYNALNPSLVDSASTPSLSAKYDIKKIDPDAKIITHDGREIDPSDHIPESNYAPLHETKGPKYASQLPDRNYRPPPNPAPQPQAVRRPLGQAGRPHSMATSTPMYVGNNTMDPSIPQGRTRLQKKSNRMSTQPAPQSSPLAPITPYQGNSYNSPRSLPRGSGDYNANENYAPQYGSSPRYMGSVGPPPIPAKVTMAMKGPHPPQSGGSDAWALLEEMKNIDLGSGRARRRGY